MVFGRQSYNFSLYWQNKWMIFCFKSVYFSLYEGCFVHKSGKHCAFMFRSCLPQSLYGLSCQLAPERMMDPSPAMKNTNIIPTSQPTERDAPLNSFQMMMPHRAATIGAPCPKA